MLGTLEVSAPRFSLNAGEAILLDRQLNGPLCRSCGMEARWRPESELGARCEVWSAGYLLELATARAEKRIRKAVEKVRDRIDRESLVEAAS